jgi:hypothetical protein
VSATTEPITAVRGAGQDWQSLFALVFGDCAGLLELRAFSGKGVAGRLFCSPIDDIAIASFVTAHREHDVYFGVATRRDEKSGALWNCLHLGVLFTDIDFKVTAEREARSRLARCPFQPNAIVHSGGGLHIYWRLREALELPADSLDAGRYLRRLARALGGDPVAAEPARVLRVPGSYNVKPEYGSARLVRVESLA